MRKVEKYQKCILICICYSKFSFIVIKKKGSLSLLFNTDYKDNLDCDSTILILSQL